MNTYGWWYKGYKGNSVLDNCLPHQEPIGFWFLEFRRIIKAAMLRCLLTACTLIATAIAAPHVILKKRNVTPLSIDEITGLKSYTQFARAAYCPTEKLEGWSCGSMLTVSWYNLTKRWNNCRRVWCLAWISTYCRRRRWRCCTKLWAYHPWIYIDRIYRVEPSLCRLLAGPGYRGCRSSRNGSHKIVRNQSWNEIVIDRLLVYLSWRMSISWRAPWMLPYFPEFLPLFKSMTDSVTNMLWPLHKFWKKSRNWWLSTTRRLWLVYVTSISNHFSLCHPNCRSVTH